MFVTGGQSDHPDKSSKWEGRSVTDLPIHQSHLEGQPLVKRHTAVAARYSRAYHEKNVDEVLSLLSPTCQFGTFFGFVWGPTATRIALAEEHSMKMHFVGKILTYSAANIPQSQTAAEASGDAESNNKSILSSIMPSKEVTHKAASNAARQSWYAPTTAGVHVGRGAPAFARVTPNVFERDGYAKRNFRSFPYNMLDYFFTLRVRETIVVEDGRIVTRVLQNLTTWFPQPYDFI